MTREYNKTKHEAEIEYREKYYLPHPPQITYRKYRLKEWGDIWALMAKQSSKELIEQWEIFSEIQSSDHKIVKGSLRFLPKTRVAIDWCTQWGTSTHQLAFSAEQVIGIETVSEAYHLACRNLAYMPQTPGDYQMQLHECTPATISSAISLVDWQTAGTIRIGSRSAPIILKQISDSGNLNAQTVVLEYTDQTLEQFMPALGYTKSEKNLNGYRDMMIWYKY